MSKNQPVDDKIVEGQMRSFGHINRMPEEKLTSRIYETRANEELQGTTERNMERLTVQEKKRKK